MGAFIVAAAAGLVAGAFAAAPWQIYARRVIPSLASARARPAAYVVAALPALAASAATIARLVGFTTGSLRADVTLIAAAIGLACSWSPIVRGALSLTGGPRPVSLEERWSAGAADDGDTGVRRAMRSAAFAMSAVLAVASAGWFIIPAYASLRACMDAERILADPDPPAPHNARLADSLPHNPPEAGAQYGFSFETNLEQAANFKHDPNTREQLVSAGFVAGYLRVWVAADGRGIQAEVMEFRSQEGAAAYQAEVTRHACNYANEAFAAPLAGIGLQVRYETGDPIVEQVSWVAGNRRYLVFVSALAPPPDHGRILAIQEATTATLPSSSEP